MSRLPAGALTFLLSDIEGSTQLWDSNPQAMRRALEQHDALVSGAIKQHRGTVHRDRGEGDSFFATFRSARDAVAAACTTQRALHKAAWPENAIVRVRIAINSGEAEPDFWHPIINRCARLRTLAHGGQTLLSAATEALVRDTLPRGASLRSLGEHRLRDLSRPERVFQLLHPDLPADFPALPSLRAFPNNLPIQLTSFIGREGDLAKVRELLLRASLLTLTGAAGCGKTRMAIQVAADVLDCFVDGVWLVDLAPVANPALVVQSMASTLCVREQPGSTILQTLIAHLQPRRSLLILDNCEHVVEACARLAEELLHACPSLKVLATSREALNVGGEIAWRVPSLSLPEVDRGFTTDGLAKSEAVRLFIDRAMLSHPNFTLTQDNATPIAQICKRLDGIPLAIELAAARVKMMPADEILSRLEDRFRLLTGGSRTALPRQQTLRAAVEWSYKLLIPPERILFDRLSVFAGSFDLEAAEAVCAGDHAEPESILDHLSHLVDKSLVVSSEDGPAAGMFRLLETLRQYGSELLARTADADETRRRHAAYFLALFEDVEQKLRGPEQRTWLTRLEEGHDNVRAALRWMADSGDVERELRLAGAMVRFWHTRGYFTEGRQWLAGALGRSSGSSPARAKALLAAARLAHAQGDYEASTQSAEKSLSMWRELGDATGLAHCLNSLGSVAYERGDLENAHRYWEQSLAVARQLGDGVGIARALNNLGSLSYEREDYEAARSLHEESLALRREHNDQWGLAMSLGNLGDALFRLGDHTAARSLYVESLSIRRELGDPHGIASGLERFAVLSCADGQPRRALHLAAAAAALRRTLGTPLYPSDLARLERRLEEARRALGPAAEAAWAEGTEMDLNEAVEYALAAEGIEVSSASQG